MVSSQCIQDAEVTVGARPERQVEVVGEQAIGDDSHGNARRRLGDHGDEGVVILRLMDDLGAGVSAVEGMVNVTGRASPCGPRHRVSRFRMTAAAIRRLGLPIFYNLPR